MVGRLRTIAEDHESELLGGLKPEQSTALTHLLSLVAEATNLDGDLHLETKMR